MMEHDERPPTGRAARRTARMLGRMRFWAILCLCSGLFLLLGLASYRLGGLASIPVRSWPTWAHIMNKLFGIGLPLLLISAACFYYYAWAVLLQNWNCRRRSTNVLWVILLVAMNVPAAFVFFLRERQELRTGGASEGEVAA